MAEADPPKTAFSDGHRLLQFTWMPFGLATGHPTLEWAIDFVLLTAIGRHTLDYSNVVICSSTFEEHLVHLKETMSL